jgi:hypothetical protein
MRIGYVPRTGRVKSLTPYAQCSFGSGPRLPTLGMGEVNRHYPTPGIPRAPDGKPNPAAPVPKAADGKPDLSGLWQLVPNPRARVTPLAMGPNLEDCMRPGEKIPPLLPAAEALQTPHPCRPCRWAQGLRIRPLSSIQLWSLAEKRRRSSTESLPRCREYLEQAIMLNPK